MPFYSCHTLVIAINIKISEVAFISQINIEPFKYVKDALIC